MFYSNKYKLLFIASPKTGTVSVHELPERLDPLGNRQLIKIGNKLITGKDLDQGIMDHARARELKKALGTNDYNSLDIMVFI
jgi:hypothetical protein